ncbi:aspartyl protease family protein [Sphingomonas arantia]|uniref:Aspartyl protease family protein n=1 Tax=Sphingomonas arantia TaxID=1460676 RepID=A0ABW4TV17_9SPHN
MLIGAALFAAPAQALQTTDRPTAASALPPAAPDPAALDPAAPAPVDPLAITALDLRMTVPVSIGGGAPWPFIIDTGAERTVVSGELVRRLRLTPGPVRRVLTMAGTTLAPTALLPGLRVGKLDSLPIEAPVFARANLGAIGMLGIDALQGQKVAIDFVTDTMTLAPSGKRRRPSARRDEIVIVAKSLYGQLIVTDARWRGRRIAVVIDTGSPVTVANLALLRIARKPPPSLGTMTLIAASGVAIPANAYLLDRVEIGGVSLLGVSVAVAEVAPFRRFGLSDRPALLLGMETLRLFRAVDIDFANRTIVLKLPR